MFSLLTICVYITTFTSFSIIFISLSDSHLELIILVIPNQAEDLKLSNSFIGCLSYDPIIIEYPYTTGTIPLIYAPFRVAYSLTICFGILFSIYLNSFDTLFLYLLSFHKILYILSKKAFCSLKSCIFFKKAFKPLVSI